MYESFVLLEGSRKKFNDINSPKHNRESEETSNRDRVPIGSKKRLVILASIIGIAIGVLGGLVGLVLGNIYVLAMIPVLKMEPRNKSIKLSSSRKINADSAGRISFVLPKHTCT